MTRDEIIKLAREAGFAINTRTGEINASHGSYNWIISRELERFAALVASAEREARAKVCDSLASPSRLSDPSRSWITEHWIALLPSEQGAKDDDPSI